MATKKRKSTKRRTAARRKKAEQRLPAGLGTLFGGLLLIVLAFALVFVMLFNGFKQFTDGITDTKTAMWILLGGNALNIVGNYKLINGKLGFPEMGLLGAGISTLFSRIVMVVVFALPLMK